VSIKRKLQTAEITSWLTHDLSREELLEDAVLAEIALAIQDYRRQRNLSQAEFAKQIGVSQTMVSRWENADGNLTLASMARIASAIGAGLRCPIASKTVA
jgi:DNA-binding transcriptional regulator YiaG